MKNLHKLTALGVCLISTMGAHAASDAVNLNVKVTIDAICDIQTVSPTDVDFGNVLSSATNVDNAGSLSVTCTQGTGYTIGLDNGQNFSGSRRMIKGTDFVAYGLYRDPARTLAWGNIAGSVLAGTGTGAVQVIPVYGRIPSANSPSGDYADVVVATVTY